MPDLSYLDKYLKPSPAGGEASAAKPLDYLDKFIPAPAPTIVSEGLKAPARVAGGFVQELGEAAQYATGDRVGTGLRRYGEKVQQDNAVDPRFAEAHPAITAVGQAAESVAKMAPYLALDAVVPVAGAGLALKAVRGLAKAALPAVIGASTGQRSYDLATAQGATPDEALHKSLLPAAVSAAGMAAMGPLGKAGRGLLPKTVEDGVVKSILNPSAAARDIGGAVLADTPVMVGTGMATAAAQQAVGIKPERTPTEIVKDPKEWISAALAGGMFGALHAAQGAVKARALTEGLTDASVSAEDRRKVVNYVGAHLPAESREAWLAQAHEAVKRGESIVVDDSLLKFASAPPAEPEAAPSPVETKADIIEGLTRSVETGETPMEAMTSGKEDSALAEITAKIDEAHSTVLSKADRLIQAGATVTARGREIDPAVRAELEAKGYVALDAGSPKDGRPRRNWEIISKEEAARRELAKQAEESVPPPEAAAPEAAETATIPEGEPSAEAVAPAEAKPAAPAEPLADGAHRFLDEAQTSALQRKGDQVALGMKSPEGKWERVALAEQNSKGEWVVDAASAETPEAAARMVSALRGAGLEVGSKFSTQENVSALTAERVQRAFPKQEVREADGGFEVSTRSGLKIKVTETGEIAFDRAAAEAAYGRPLKEGEVPVASFATLGKEGFISLTERGVGEIDHEAFHAAVAMALTSKEVAQVLKRYGSEEAAASAYQKFRDGKGPATGWWNKIKELLTRLKDLVMPNADTVFRKLASGEAWLKAKREGGSALTRYMIEQLYRGDSTHADGLGSGSVGDLGKGLYFADSKGAAEYFTDGSDPAHTREFQVDLKKPFDMMGRDHASDPAWQEMLKAAPRDLDRTLLNKWANNDLDVRNPYQFLARSFGQTPETFNDFLAKHGYDGVVDQGIRGVSEGGRQYVVFDREAVKQTIAKFSLGRDRAAVNDATEPVLKDEALRVTKGMARGLYNYIFPVDRVINLAVSSPEYRPIAKHLKELQQWHDIKGRYAQGVVRAGSIIYDKHVSPVLKTDADHANFNKSLYVPSLYQMSEAGSEWTERSWKKAGLHKATGKSLAEARAEVKEALAALTPEQREARKKVLDHVQELRQGHLEALEDNIRGLFSKEVVDAARSLNKAVDDAHLVLTDEALRAEVARLQAVAGAEAVAIANPIAQLDATKSLKGDYFPLMRFGNHVVKGAYADGRPVDKRFDTQIEARKEMAKLQAAGAEVRYDFQDQVHMREEANIPLNFLDKYKSILETRGIDGQRADNVMNDLKALWVNTLSQYSFRNHLLQRKSVAGFEEDAHKTYLTYARRYGQAIANTRYGGKIDGIFREMANSIDVARAEGAKPESIDLMKKLHNQLYEQHTATEGEKVNGVVKTLTATTFLYYLTSPSVWAVQWSQPFMTTIPKLAVQHGIGGAMKAFTRGARNYIAGHYSDAKLDAFEERTGGLGEKTFRIMEELWSLPETASGTIAAAKERMAGEMETAASPQEAASLRVKHARELKEIEKEALAQQEAKKKELSDQVDAAYSGLSKGEQELLTLNLMARQGLRDLSISHNAFDAMLPSDSPKGAMDKLLPGSGKAWNKVTETLALPMQKSETGSRSAAAISALELARSKGMSYVDAHAYARDVITDSLFNFSSSNRAKWMRGNTGRVVGQFQLYRLHMMGKTFQLTKDAIGTDFKERLAAAEAERTKNVETYGETEATRLFEQEKAEIHKARDNARKELAYMTGMGMGLAGAAGTPLSMLVSNSVTTAVWEGLKLLFSDPDDPWDPEIAFNNAVRESLGDTAGTALLKGLPTLLGWDISKRVGASGMADFIQGDPPPNLTGTARANWYAGRILGPSWGMVSDGFRSMDALQKGDMAEAFEMSSPKFYKDFVRTLRVQDHGVVAGGKTLIQPDEIGPYDAALMMIGINPLEVSLAQEEAREIKGLSATLSQRRSNLLRKFTKAQLDGDFDTRDEVLQDISAWSRKQPKMKITAGDLISSYRRGLKGEMGVDSEREKDLKGQLEGM